MSSTDHGDHEQSGQHGPSGEPGPHAPDVPVTHGDATTQALPQQPASQEPTSYEPASHEPASRQAAPQFAAPQAHPTHDTQASSHAPTIWHGAHEPAGPVFPPPPAHGAAPQQPTTEPRPRRRLGELVAVAALTAALATGGTYAATQLGSQETQSPTASSSSSLGRGAETAPVSQSNPQSPNWTATAAAVSPSVVAIKTDSGEGSGVVIDDSGHVITNNHVVAGADELTVTMSDGRTFKARIQGTDPSTDLAVVTIEGAPDDLRPISIGDSDALKVGDPVMAVGNPLGLAGTVTTGIVSALNRPVTTSAAQQGPQNPFGNGPQQSSTEPVVTNAIQTSAAINPGNSGGALVNANGQLVGINSSIASLGSSGGTSGNIGIGFAIPVKEAASIAEQLIEDGTAEHAYLGVAPADGSASDGSATRAGALVRTVVSGTPAEKAGLKQGDVITQVNGEAVDSAESLVAHIREHAVGDTVTLTVLRDNKSQEISATLVATPAG
ncbi:S1C family serine protease [Knoellia aerolata]|uniref:Trypsin n=1 Tax=Knoellia aerolata DSM 18566 TaxID=1385519 RepID=A0A0A0JVL8_9MICO|nr:trypsin-like peptidase domain-containing protein [Knoellia aerolata]KGN40097.1 trypsin [Knoellia aerolata DSM 18566]